MKSLMDIRAWFTQHLSLDLYQEVGGGGGGRKYSTVMGQILQQLYLIHVLGCGIPVRFQLWSIHKEALSWIS